MLRNWRQQGLSWTWIVFVVILCRTEAFAQELDLCELIRAPGKIEGLWEGAKRGYKVTFKLTPTGGTSSKKYYAIVGEDEEHWHVEYRGNQITSLEAKLPQLKEHIMALKVRKSDLRVVAARLGKPGQPLLTLKINKIAEKDKRELPNSSKFVKLTLDGVEYESNYFVNEGVEAWSVAKGQFAGLLLKVRGEKRNFELTSKIKVETVKLKTGENKKQELRVFRVKYSNGMELLYCKHKVIRCFWFMGIHGLGVYLMKTPDFTQTVLMVETEARAKLNWNWIR